MSILELVGDEVYEYNKYLGKTRSIQQMQKVNQQISFTVQEAQRENRIRELECKKVLSAMTLELLERGDYRQTCQEENGFRHPIDIVAHASCWFMHDWDYKCWYQPLSIDAATYSVMAMIPDCQMVAPSRAYVECVMEEFDLNDGKLFRKDPMYPMHKNEDPSICNDPSLMMSSLSIEVEKEEDEQDSIEILKE